MTSPQRHTARAALGSIALRLLLTVAIMAPSTVLFRQVWSADADTLDVASQERHGIEYLTTLGPLLTALTNVESAAVAGQAAPVDILDRAVRAVDAMDERLGAELRTQDRWTQVRIAIEAAGNTRDASPAATYIAYDEATDLLLALYDKVRNQSGLVRDPQADTYYLAEAVAQTMPESLVSATRYANLALLALAATGAEQEDALNNALAVHAELVGNTDDLGQDLELAVAATTSQTLSKNLLDALDQFRQSSDTLTSDAVIPRKGLVPAGSTLLGNLRASAQSDGAELTIAMLTALDSLLKTRVTQIRDDQRLALGALAAAALISLIPLLNLVVRRRRPRPAASAADGHGRHEREATSAEAYPISPEATIATARVNREYQGAAR